MIAFNKDIRMLSADTAPSVRRTAAIYPDEENLVRLLPTLWSGGDVYTSVNGLAGKFYITPMCHRAKVGDIVLCRVAGGAFLNEIIGWRHGAFLVTGSFDEGRGILHGERVAEVEHSHIEGLVLRVDA